VSSTSTRSSARIAGLRSQTAPTSNRTPLPPVSTATTSSAAICAPALPGAATRPSAATPTSARDTRRSASYQTSAVYETAAVSSSAPHCTTPKSVEASAVSVASSSARVSRRGASKQSVPIVEMSAVRSSAPVVLAPFQRVSIEASQLVTQPIVNATPAEQNQTTITSNVTIKLFNSQFVEILCFWKSL
jgi:hypothetical protein